MALRRVAACAFACVVWHVAIALPLAARTADEPSIATTPQGAARNSVGGTVVRTNVVGDHAVVWVHDGTDEGTTEDMLVLTERFSTGWQSLTDLFYGCELNSFVSDAPTRTALLRDMMAMHPAPAGMCARGFGDQADYGPAADIAAIRALETSAFFHHVVVAGDYAIGNWSGGGGGPHLFKKTNGTWHLIAGTGGMPDDAWLAEKGVPKSYWCKLLRGQDPPCPQ